MNSNAKGKKGELEIAHMLTDSGFPARRGKQYKGDEESPDVICPSLEDVHIECTRDERLNIHTKMDKAKEDSGGKIPVVFHRKNKTDWLVTMAFDEWVGRERIIRLQDQMLSEAK